jgi:hypothetical protein
MSTHLAETIERATREVAQAQAEWDDAREHVLSLEDAIGATIDYGPVEATALAHLKARARLTDLMLIQREIAAQHSAETLA